MQPLTCGLLRPAAPMKVLQHPCHAEVLPALSATSCFRAVRLAGWLSVLALTGGWFAARPYAQEGQIPPAQPAPHVASRVPSGETGSEREHLFKDWHGWRTRAIEHGFHWSSGYTAEALRNVSGGLSVGSVAEALWEIALDVDPSRFSRWRGSRIHVSALYPHGASLTQKHVGDLSVLSNIDAYDSFRLFEFWLEQRWWEDQLSLRIGQLAADEEFAGTDSSEAFVNSSFGWAPFISANVPTPAFALAAPGVRLRFDFASSWFVQAALFDGNPDPGDANGRPLNQHGIRFNVNEREGVLTLLEGGYATDTLIGPGTYKLGAWLHTADSPHQRLDRDGLSLADPASTGVPRGLSPSWGVYLALDQVLWRERPGEDEQGLSAFARFAGGPADRNFIEATLDAGFAYQGMIPSRDLDQCGVGIAYLKVSGAAADFVRDQRRFTGATDAVPDHEISLETFYRVHLAPWWTVQPDVQYVIHPGGSAATPDALVIGARVSVVF